MRNAWQTLKKDAEDSATSENNLTKLTVAEKRLRYYWKMKISQPRVVIKEK